jgi:ABC-type branched-subunit amino acid transport system ATPase component
VLLVEHVLRLVADACDEVTVLDAGRVCARGTPAEVLVDARVMASYGGASAAGER